MRLQTLSRRIRDTTISCGYGAAVLLSSLPNAYALPTSAGINSSSSTLALSAGNETVTVDLDGPLLLVTGIGLAALVCIRQQKQVSRSLLGTVALASAVGGIGWAAICHELATPGRKAATLVSLCIILWTNLVGCCMRCLKYPWWHFAAAMVIATLAVATVSTLSEMASSNARDIVALASIARQSAFLFATLADIVAFGAQDLYERHRRENHVKAVSTL